MREEGGNVSQLRSIFEGAGGRKKAMEASMRKGEADLKRGRDQAKEGLARAEAQIQEMSAGKEEAKVVELAEVEKEVE